MFHLLNSATQVFKFLEVRVNLTGDAADADISEAIDWLADKANVKVVPDSSGVPLYLTYKDLVATSGSSALGATVRSGMVVEVGRSLQCVVAHELLHFLGLHHIGDEKNIMYARCSFGKLRHADLSEEQRSEIDRLGAIYAMMPGRGIVTWAVRST